ncbi:MAG: Ig-like domain-containing protein [Nitrospirota bacterium]|nr:Ig-like domain-containing protein [Nitrospirota bacterium]
MKKRLAIPTFLIVMLFLSGCTGGDFNGTGVKSGLGTDVTPPTVLGTVPAAGATGVGIYDTIWANFSEPIDTFTVDSVSFTLTTGGTSVLCGVGTWGDTWAYISPYTALAYDTVYTATITTAVKDKAGNAFAANYTWTFTTTSAADIIRPTVIVTSPISSATGVSINTIVTAGFSEALNSGTIAPATFYLTAGTASTVVSTVSYTNAVATLTPSSALASNTTYTATLTTGVADLAGNALVANYNWSFTTVAAPSITTATLPDGTETGVYSYTLTGAGGITPYVWSTTTTTMPSGLSLSSAGVLSGTLAAGTAAGSPYTIDVTLTDADGLTATRSLTLTVGAGPAVVENTLLQGTETGAYSQTLTGTGGAAPYTWNATGLPSGVTLSTAGPSATTALTSSSILAAAGTYTITVTVTDSGGLSANKDLALVVNAVPTVSTASLADAGMGAGYGPATLTGSNGTTPYSSWSATPLPAGMTFDTSTGILSGTPSGPTGTFDIGFTVTDAKTVTSATTTLPLTIRPTITTTSLLDSTETGTTYSMTLAATGTGLLTWSQSGLPAGLLFNTGTGEISGAPNAGTAGTYAVGFTVTDSTPVTSATVTLSLVVNATPTITTASPLTQWSAVNGPQSVTFTTSNGTAPFTWSSTDLAGVAPWLTLSTAGVLSGDATTAGIASGTSYTFNITATDKWGVVTARTYVLNVQ